MKELTVSTFNMQFGQIWDESDPDHAPVIVERAVEQIRALDTDIIFLQEVEQVIPRRGQEEPPPHYTLIRAALPDYDGHFGYPPPDERQLPFGYGLAILSKYPLRDRERRVLPAPELTFDFFGEPKTPTHRILIGAKIEVQGRLIQLYNTHLQAFFVIRRSSNDFPLQRDILEELLRSARLPTIFGGDFNAASDETIVQQLEGTGFRSVQTRCVTCKRFPHVLDHIFISPQFRSVNHELIATDSSDHHVLRARLQLNENK